MRISVVTTMYHSAAFLPEFHRRCTAALAPTGHEIEFVFVDDGSPDDSARIARALPTDAGPVRVVRLSRNYGHHRAILVGLGHATGELVFLIDCDLEEPPELFGAMYARMQAERDSDEPIDVVYALPQRRKGGLLERLAGAAFYRLFNWLSGLEMPASWMIARLMTRRYVEGLLAHRERELFLGGLFWITGFRQEAVHGAKRHKGSTTWTLRRKLRVAVEAFTAFSDRPLWLLVQLGGLTALASALGGFWLLLARLVLDVPYQMGWPSVVLAIGFFGGLNLLAVALVGLYVGRIFLEVKQRPCIVKEIHDQLGTRNSECGTPAAPHSEFRVPSWR